VFFTTRDYSLKGVRLTTAIIGVGNIGSPLGRHLVGGGEVVVLATKDQSRAQALADELGPLARAASVEDAIAGADAVVFAVWLDTIKDLIPQHARLLEDSRPAVNLVTTAVSGAFGRRPTGDEACDRKFRPRHGGPPARLGFGGDEAPPHAEFAEAAADAAGVPGRAELCVEGEGTAEGVDGGVAVGCDQVDAQVFECGRELESSRCALEEIDRLTEIRMARLDKTADMSGGCRDRRDAGIQLCSTSAIDERKLLELVVV
jgi:hypothetical protein